MKKTRWLVLVVVLLGLIPAPAAARRDGPADLSRLVVIGDSLSAGFQNSSLLGSQQVHGYASLIAAQAGVSLSLPLIADPGIPSVLQLIDVGPPPVIGQAPGSSTGRLDPTVQVTALAVPGATVEDALTLVPDCDFTPANAPPVKQVVNVLTDVVLGLPGCFINTRMSQVQWAEALSPTTVLVWLGNQDALQAVIYGADPSLVTPVKDFKRAYRTLMRRLAGTQATIVVANIPDVTVIPYLTPAEDVASITGLPLTIVGPLLGIDAGDFVTPDAFPLIPGILATPGSGPLPGAVVVDAGEIATIRQSIKRFNTIIQAEADEVGAAVVDIHGLLDRAAEQGLFVGDRRLTTDFLGGLFSLDGIHPTNTGYAIIANQFIKALNRAFHAGIPPVDVSAVMANDPLVFP
jgi:phospholipase/lecithinase/hemolysin